MHIKNKILKLLETNSKLETRDLSLLLDIPEEEVIKYITELEADKIICGYHTLINWDRTNNDNVSAMIELKVNPEKGTGFDKIASKIAVFEEVESLYLISGRYDLLVKMRQAPMKSIARFVASKLSIIDEVQSTSTNIILNKYKEHGTIYEIIEYDDRQVITP